ncbi:HNH endonuclease [Chloroflexota bacterium]
MKTINTPVLVLNQDYRPVNICRVRRAVILVFQGKAEVLENGRGMIHGVSHSLPIPSVIRLAFLVKPPRYQRRLTGFEVFNRDKHTCQYCGKAIKELTLDHIIPRYREGEHNWENVVTCCIPCNRHKAGRTPQEAGMRLLKKPLPPPPASFYIPYQYLNTNDRWQKFLIQGG